jgi:hypothetical protein
MKIKTSKLQGLILVLTSVFYFVACSDKNDDQSRISVRLTDAPGDYDEVNIEVIDVQITTLGAVTLQ